MPQVPLATIFGTNKFASIWGTATAAVQYARKVPMEWHVILPTTLSALFFSFLGSMTLNVLRPETLRPLIMGLLVIVLVFTVRKKNFGSLHAHKRSPKLQIGVGILIGAVMGFYDGFFGPGTGSFLIVAFVGLLRFSFLTASAAAKIVNVVTNLAALAYFSWHGNILYGTALAMATCNTAGGYLGSRMAIRKGNGFVRGLLIVMASVLLVRLACDFFSN